MTDRTCNRRRVLALTVSVAAGIAGCSSPAVSPAAQPGSPSDTSQSPATADQQTTATDTAAADDPSVYTDVYRETIDSVVLVQTDTGQGTGFLIEDGYVVTNAHVVGEADTADVRFRDGTWVTGTVAGRDVYSDLAVIDVSSVPSIASPLSFAQTEPVVGQEVVVIGNPFGLDGTVTAGIVSGVNRSIPSVTGYSIPDAVQTDAAVNPGNSGGPIVSLDGRVIAVINSGGGDNVAFGISAALATRIIPALIETGSYSHSYMGVGLRSMTPEVATANDLPRPRGILVESVVPGTPAEGVLQPSTRTAVVDGQQVPVGGDVILAIDGTTISTIEDLNSYLALETRPGDTIAVTVRRDGTERTIDFELGTRPPPN